MVGFVKWGVSHWGGGGGLVVGGAARSTRSARSAGSGQAGSGQADSGQAGPSTRSAGSGWHSGHAGDVARMCSRASRSSAESWNLLVLAADHSPDFHRDKLGRGEGGLEENAAAQAFPLRRLLLDRRKRSPSTYRCILFPVLP